MRNVLETLWTARLSGLRGIGGGGLILGLLDGIYEQGRRQDGLRLFSCFFGSVEMGKGICLNILGVWMIGDGKIGTGEK